MVKEISLTRGRVALVDDEDFEWLSTKKWCIQENRKNGHAYAHTSRWKGKKYVYMHRIIIGAKKGQIVDHINGNTLDNRSSNLRIVTPRQNQQNMHYERSSKYPGVSWYTNDKKWVARIQIEGKNKGLGYFKSEKEAFEAYKKAVHELVGEKLVCELDSSDNQNATLELSDENKRKGGDLNERM